MKLDSEFYRLPLTFDVEKMTEEVNRFKESDWMPHPTGFAGNGSIPLISVNGGMNDDFSGEMKTTDYLEKSPYLQQVISSFNEVFGRSRLMKLSGGSSVPEHTDFNYHWYNRVRIHIPIITYPEVTFYCGSKNVHMAPGETWIFDSWDMHKVINPTNNERIHLVIDTSGSSHFWDMVSKSDRPHDNFTTESKPKFLNYSAKNDTQIKTEKYNIPIVMSPGEMDALCIDLINDTANNNNNPKDLVTAYTRTLNDFRHDWRAIWLQYNESISGFEHYLALLEGVISRINSVGQLSLASNESNAIHVFHARILHVCLNKNHFNTKNKPRPNTESTEAPNVGRNSPCPCGSGKKYKRCHGKN